MKTNLDEKPDCFGTEKEEKSCRKCKFYRACFQDYARKLIEKQKKENTIETTKS